MTKGGKKWLLSAVMIALIAAISGTLLAWWNPLEKQQLYLSNFLYYERPTENQVVVVSIDDQTVSEAGLGKFSSWCRTNYIPVLQKLAGYEPAVIGIDILFLSKSEGLCKDDLAKVLNSSDPASELQKYADPQTHPDDRALGEQIQKMSNLFLLTRVAASSNEERADLGDESYVQYPQSSLGIDNRQTGHNRIIADSSGLIRYIIPAYLYKQEPVVAFSLKLIQAYLDMGDSPVISITSNEMSMDGNGHVLRVPLEGYRMQVNYNEKPDLKAQSSGNVLTIPFIDLYRNTADYSPLIKDKIVLVGTRFSSSEDKFQTPIDPTNALYGVMIHAQAIQTILDQAWLRNMSFPEQAAVILLLALAAAALIFRLRISLALPLLAVIVLGYEVAAAPLFFRWQGLILNMVYPPLTVILAAIVGYAYRYVTEFHQKTRVAGALGQYVNRDVAEQVLEGRGSAVKAGGGEKRQITVLFTDIRGFTTISENLQPQSAVALLNEYFEVMAAQITRFGGTLDKYEGDAIMAFFEDAPDSAAVNQTPATPAMEPHAIRAARAALGMRAALPALLEKWRNDPPLPGGEKKPEIDFRVGLSSGEAIVGNIGTAEHIQYTVIGDIVNLGSRLESANKKYQTNVMIAEATYESIKDVFACRFLDYIEVKGKSNAVAIYELLCEQSTLPAEQKELIQAYNLALEMYFKRDFAGTLAALQENVLKRWPHDYPATIIAGRCERFKIYPPPPDWDFVYKMDSK